MALLRLFTGHAVGVWKGDCWVGKLEVRLRSRPSSHPSAAPLAQQTEVHLSTQWVKMPAPPAGRTATFWRRSGNLVSGGWGRGLAPGCHGIGQQGGKELGGSARTESDHSANTAFVSCSGQAEASNPTSGDDEDGGDEDNPGAPKIKLPSAAATFAEVDGPPAFLNPEVSLLIWGACLLAGWCGGRSLNMERRVHASARSTADRVGGCG